MSLDSEPKTEPLKLHSTWYTPFGRSGESPIIFLHGLFSSHRTWFPVRGRISDKTKREVITYDLRNHGKSEWSDNTSIEHDVEDLKNLMDSKNISKAILIAHSIGARIAMTFTFKYGSMVEKLIVEDMSLRFKNSQIETFRSAAAVIQQVSKIFKTFPSSYTEEEAQEKVIKYIMDFVPELSNGTSKTAFQLFAPLHKDYKRNTFVWDVNMELARDIETKHLVYRLDLEKNPVYEGDTLFITADHSYFPLENDKEEIMKCFPKAQFKTFENGFHAYHQEDPELFSNIASDFITDSKV